MKSFTAALDRRWVLKAIAATPIAAGLPARARAQDSSDAILLSISDLHSPYARLPALLEEVRGIVRGAGVPVGMVINGDLFERGNVAATRSGASADWAFLEALAAELPLVVNLGNHETAILDDMTVFVARATAAGAQVIGNLVDRRTGRFFAPVSTRMGLGGIDIALMGVGTDNPFVYRPPARDTLSLLDPVGFVSDAFADATGGADLPVLVSHAGVMADRAILPDLAAGTLILGAHDHLDFVHEADGLNYLHGGAWARNLAVIGLSRTGEGVTVSHEMRAIAPMGGDAALAETIAAVKAEHLTTGDTAVITERAEALDLPASILLAAEAVRAASEADLAVLGHTTFGAPLAAGPLTRYDFDAFIRFDGAIAVAEVPGDVLAQIMTRANQHQAGSLDQRTGDFIHAAEIEIDPARIYRLATNGWTARNQDSYLGTSDLEFAETEGMTLKAVVAEALAAGL
ncbi:5'-nucleotidase C-terminal domain-containing protein [Rhodophyticola porphyridii]|uniref:Bifunctional metallophosphatase/5'-nucleotidase n=1 Tax=Rhodophyticola porphyridii TaxID=1852017 RepID=A0A3L9Y7R7_9RHOB|nr:5'-nucleotidase C-terminal domain-containing protein [Rhodophyticola porphyridii]RMA42116.1 bifunctional metallophosphatase/5'-nucleotidase [Rhodophyticola porphyridii]